MSDYGGATATRYKIIRYRIDKGQVIDLVGQTGNNNTGVVLNSKFNGKAEFRVLLNGLQAGNKIAVEAFSNEQEVRDQFSLKGSRKNVGKVLRQCRA
jgi:hypothetical protein